MSSDICVRRLTKELRDLKKNPLEQPRIVVAPNESNILEMHYVIEGSPDTPYAGGFYHGKLIFPKEYPLKPPSVIMITPSGRFSPGRRLCLSMSDFHPESWNPVWSVATILTGLYSFMIETSPTLGSIETSLKTKRKLAVQSLEYNVKKTPIFSKLFPEYVDRYQKELAKNPPSVSVSKTSDPMMLPAQSQQTFMALMAGFVAIFSILVAMRFV